MYINLMCMFCMDKFSIYIYIASANVLLHSFFLIALVI